MMMLHMTVGLIAGAGTATALDFDWTGLAWFSAGAVLAYFGRR